MLLYYDKGASVSNINKLRSDLLLTCRNKCNLCNLHYIKATDDFLHENTYLMCFLKFLFQLEKYVSVSKAKYYFAVDTTYVGKKLGLLVFPFTHTVSLSLFILMFFYL